jgi:hypothetical protein
MNSSHLEESTSHNSLIIVTGSRIDSYTRQIVQAVAHGARLSHIVVIALSVIQPMRDPFMDLNILRLDDLPDVKKVLPHSHLIAQQTSLSTRRSRFRTGGNKKQSTKQSGSKRGRRR